MSFASDAVAIFAGPLASDAIYTSAVGVPVALRVIRRRPDAEVSFGDARLRVATAVFLILVADLPERPVAGSTILCDGVLYRVQGSPERDDRHLRWQIEARPE